MANNMPFPSYAYEKLAAEDSIRIIVLHPGDEFDALQCNILTASRSELTHSAYDHVSNYEAVSYTWGNHEFTEVLVCDGNSILKITPSVDLMLRRLRKTSRSRDLWVDAISLNQADNDEKSQQVPLMTEIYRQASKVIIWLGDDERGVTETFALLRHVSCMEVQSSCSEQIEEQLTDVWGKNWYQIVELFLQRPWFHRRWVLQEAALSRVAMVRCHRAKIPWPWFVGGLNNLQKLPRYSEDLRSSRLALHVLALKTIRIVQQRDLDMLDLLWDLDHTHCADHRDRLFALYGIVSKSPVMTTPLPTVDYTLEWSITFTEFASFQFHINTARMMRHLLAFGSLSDISGDLPSWVPNWTMLKRIRSLPDWPDVEIDLRRDRSVRVGFDQATISYSEMRIYGPIQTFHHVLRPISSFSGVENIKNWVSTITGLSGPMLSRDKYVESAIINGIETLLDRQKIPGNELKLLADAKRHKRALDEREIRDSLPHALQRLQEDCTFFMRNTAGKLNPLGIASGDIRAGDSLIPINYHLGGERFYYKFCIGIVVRLVNTTSTAVSVDGNSSDLQETSSTRNEFRIVGFGIYSRSRDAEEEKRMNSFQGINILR
jgi:hypothetical protein